MTVSNLATVVLTSILLFSCTQSPSTEFKDSISKGELHNNGTLLSASCSGCHAPKSIVGDLDNLTQEQLSDLMTSYKEDSGTTVMHRLMKGYSNQDILLISEYLGKTDE